MENVKNIYSIYIIAFLTGFSFMGYEILGSRILAPYFGGSVYTWGAMISVFMFGLCVGYSLGGRLADKRGKPIDLFLIFFASVLMLLVISYISRIICIIALKIPVDTKYTALLVSTVLFFIPSVLWGMVLPYLVSLSKWSKFTIGRTVGRIYASSTGGSIFGVIIVSFYLVGYLGTGECIRIMCLTLFICILLVLPVKRAVGKL
ncbi:MAG: fused MFS/spermidine synthase [Victivallales bacterium]|nr:fused MFS/spermidine synthase [Victivallales bacterium]MCF7888606.1 fused MFS/spermidine synthase [Victivallales bacterium]